MRVLIDTHVWLWMWSEPEKLRNEARTIVEDPGTELHVSAVSAWEIAVKAQAGRLRLSADPSDWLADPRRLADITQLPITFAHASRAGSLPPNHRDPFDRMLVAQALVEGLPLMTADPELAAYPVDVIPA